VKLDELSGEVEAYKEKSASLEALLAEANQKEDELSGKLAQANEEKEKYEELSKKATSAHLEAEKQVQTLQCDLEFALGKMEEVENDLVRVYACLAGYAFGGCLKHVHLIKESRENIPADAARARPLCGGRVEISVSDPIGRGRNGPIGARVHVALRGLWVVALPCKRLRV
jgi:predicted RNase H-like nuclease (RuvC/YqgF family)